MHLYLQICWEYIINLIESALFYYYVRTFFTAKKIPHQKLVHFTGVLIRFFIINICNRMNILPMYCIIFASLYNMLFTCKLFKEKNILCIFWGGLHTLVCTVSEFIAILFLQIFANIVPSDILFGESYRFPVTTLYIIILAAFSFYLPTIPSKKALFTRKQNIFVSFTVLLGITISHLFIYLMFHLEQTHPELIDVLILTNIVFLCFFISLLFYMYQLALSQQENEELQERARLLELETAQYHNLLNTTEALRVIKHDIRHHLSTIQSLVHIGEQERLETYLTEYQTHLDLDYTIASTGNIVVDSILSTKLYAAKQQQTRLTYTVTLPNALPLSDVALSPILGNLFDNALEACRRIHADTPREIDFQMKMQGHMLLIHIENSFDGVVKQKTTHGFLSRKSEPDHGIGLARVHTLIEEANGFMKISYDKQRFIVHIMVPLEDANEI